MLTAYLGWIAIMLPLSGTAVVVYGFRTRPRGEAIHCPGPRCGWPGRLSPRRWFFRCGCWYNLTGLPQQEDGSLRCPECGTRSRAAELLREGRRWRPQVCGVVLCVASLSIMAVPWVQSGVFVRGLPTPLLAAIELGPYRWQPRTIRLETGRRALAGELDAVSARVIARGLVADLAHDDIRWNAERAAEVLDGMWPTSRGALESALGHRDRQARMIAAWILRNHCTMDPSAALLVTCVEDLRDDDREAIWWTMFNARDAATYLARFPERVEPLLSKAMQSDDGQQQTLAAAIAGYAGMETLVAAAAPILIPHLRDDGIDDNAKLAAPALYHFGAVVIPHLEAATNDPDPQLRAIARSMIEQLLHPKRPVESLENPMPRITERTHDPLRNLGLCESMPQLPRTRPYP